MDKFHRCCPYRGEKRILTLTLLLQFVARCLMEVCSVNDGAAFQIMMNAHQNGAAVIGRYDFERAELYYTSLRDNGLTVDMVKVSDSD